MPIRRRGGRHARVVCDALVEAIDLAPSFIRYFGGEPKPHVMEGRALQPLLHGAAVPEWRRHVFSEYDYAMMPARRTLGRRSMAPGCSWCSTDAGNISMRLVFGRCCLTWRADPGELHDRGADAACAGECARLKDALLEWSLRDHNRITMPDARIAGYGEASQLKSGIVIGFWDQAELDAARRG